MNDKKCGKLIFHLVEMPSEKPLEDVSVDSVEELRPFLDKYPPGLAVELWRCPDCGKDVDVEAALAELNALMKEVEDKKIQNVLNFVEDQGLKNEEGDWCEVDSTYTMVHFHRENGTHFMSMPYEDYMDMLIYKKE